MPKDAIILYGGGSPLIVEYEEICLLQEIEVTAIVNNMEQVECHSISEARQITPDQIISDLESTPFFLCPFFTPINRYKATEEAKRKGLQSVNILSAPSNLLPKTFVHGHGIFLNKGVTIGAVANFGNHVLVNRGATLGHHLDLEDYVSIGPGVVTGGNVNIGRGTMIGVGATILPSIKIGKHAIIGAGAVVTKDVKDNAVMIGNPAKQIKETSISF